LTEIREKKVCETEKKSTGKKCMGKKVHGKKKKNGENRACAEHTSEKRAGNPVGYPWDQFGHVTS